MKHLAIRPLQRADIPRLVEYWISASAADLERMAVDPAKIPSAHALTASLETLCATPPSEVASYYLVWLVDGAAIGHCSLKNIARGERGEIHLHMWETGERGQGSGATLFCRSALDFYQRFQLREIVCEPSVDNPMPNRMLQRVGFPLRGTRIGASSELSKVCKLATYSVDRAVAARYLERMAAAPLPRDGERSPATPANESG